MGGTQDHPAGMSARQVARRLGVAPDLILREIRAGRLTAYRVGQRRLLIPWARVEEWLEAHRIRPTAHAEAVVERVLAREERAGP